MYPSSLEMELQAFAIHLTEVLGTEFRSYARAGSLDCQAVSPEWFKNVTTHVCVSAHVPLSQHTCGGHKGTLRCQSSLPSLTLLEQGLRVPGFVCIPGL